MRHIPEDLKNLREHRCEYLKMSHEVFLLKYRVCFLLRIQGVPGGMDKTSGECSLG